MYDQVNIYGLVKIDYGLSHMVTIWDVENTVL